MENSMDVSLTIEYAGHMVEKKIHVSRLRSLITSLNKKGGLWVHEGEVYEFIPLTKVDKVRVQPETSAPDMKFGIGDPLIIFEKTS